MANPLIVQRPMLVKNKCKERKVQVCIAVYFGRASDDVFETFLKTFRKVNQSALLQVYTDNIPQELMQQWRNDYKVEWRRLTSGQVKNQRCYRRMKCVRDCLAERKEGDQLLVSDVDVYFLDDPFNAFEKCEFELGLTTRLHSYKYPINSGLFFIKVCPHARITFNEYFNQFAERNKEYWDWFVDQMFLCDLWKSRETVSLKIADVGWEYNFCPNTDVFGVKLAADMIRRAYESKSVKVLHLKSELKMMIYDGFLEDAVTKYMNGGWNWYKDCK